MDLEKNRIDFKADTPNSYFESLEKQIQAQINIEKMRALNIEKSPLYFENLESSILSKTVKQPKVEWKIWKNTRWYAAAIVLMVASLGYWQYKNLNTYDFDDLSAQEIEVYLNQEASIDIETENLIAENQYNDDIFSEDQIDELDENEIKAYLD
jgi:hypothetical protein